MLAQQVARPGESREAGRQAGAGVSTAAAAHSGMQCMLLRQCDKGSHHSAKPSLQPALTAPSDTVPTSGRRLPAQVAPAGPIPRCSRQLLPPGPVQASGPVLPHSRSHPSPRHQSWQGAAARPAAAAAWLEGAGAERSLRLRYGQGSVKNLFWCRCAPGCFTALAESSKVRTQPHLHVLPAPRCVRIAAPQCDPAARHRHRCRRRWRLAAGGTPQRR